MDPIERRLLDLLSQAIRTFPKLIVAGFLVAGAAAAYYATQVRLERGLEYLLAENDPERERNHQIKEEFSNDEIVVVALELGRPFEFDDLVLIAELSERFAAIEGVEEVVDFTTAEDIRDREGFLDTSMLIEPARLGAAETAAEQKTLVSDIKERLGSHRLFERNLVSEDFASVAILVIPKLVDGAPSGLVNLGVVNGLTQVLSEYDVTAWIGGYPAAEVDSTRIGLRDLTLLTGAAMMLIVIMSSLLLRSGLAVFLLLVLVVWAEVSALGWLGLVNAPLTVITALLPTILVATSATYAIYTFSMLREVSPTDDPGPAVLRRVARPCVVSALSTAAGFFAIRFVGISTLQELGTALALGIFGCLLGCLLLLPALLQILRPNVSPAPAIGERSLLTLGVDFARRPWLVIGVTAVVATIAILGVLRVEIESDPITYWKKKSFHRQSDEYLREHFDGSLFVNVILTTPSPDAALESEVLDFASQLIEYAEQSPIVTRTLSLLDFLALIDDAMDPEAAELGDRERAYLSDPGLGAQYMLLYENSGSPEDFRHYVNFDRSALNIFLKVNSRSSNEILALRQHIYFWADHVAGRPEDLDVEILGTWLLFPKAMDGITRNMIRGLVVALVAILIIMTLSLRSLPLGLISIIPNVLPVIVCIGLMGWLGVPISFITSICGCLALGLAVDDTAHVLGHLRPGEPIREAYRAVGPAVLSTSVILGTGFLVLTLSDFLPIIHLGIATAITLAVAFLCDILVLPSLLRLLGWPLDETEGRASSEARGSSPAG